MKKNIFLFVFLFSCEKDQIFGDCGAECYTGDPKELQYESCHRGVVFCDQNGNRECRGERLPSAETCDGIDNDCDGQIDNIIEQTYQDCKTDCGLGVLVCEGGQYVCLSNARSPSPEVCDGIDNDCDGQVDEPEDLPFEFCYTGKQSELLSFGECRPGILSCISGRKVCLGQVLPTSETCDSKDNNCDGKIDDGVIEQKERDIIFIVDVSCSMTNDKLAFYSRSLFEFTNKFPDSDMINYGLLHLGITPEPYYKWVCKSNSSSERCSKDLFLQSLNTLSISDGSYEPTYDAILDVIINNVWFSERKYIVYIGDEQAQTFTQSPNYVSTSTVQNHEWVRRDITSLLIENNINFIGFFTILYKPAYTFRENDVTFDINDPNVYKNLLDSIPLVCEGE